MEETQNFVVKSTSSSSALRDHDDEQGVQGDDHNNNNNNNEQNAQQDDDLMEEDDDASFSSDSVSSEGLNNDKKINASDDNVDEDDEAAEQEQQQEEDDDDDGGGKPSAVINNNTDENAVADATSAPAALAEETENKERMRTTSKTFRTTIATSQDKVSHEERWNEMYSRLLTFRNKHGHCRVPNRFEEDSQLGFWVSAQRRQYKLSSKTGAAASALTPERIRKLEAIGFQWSSTNPHHTPWETRYEELRAFVRTYGHAEVPIRWKQNPKLSHWVSKQRHDYKLKKAKKSSRLSDEKVRLLNEVGFLWEGSRRSLKDKVALDPKAARTNDAEGETASEESPSVTQHPMIQMASVPSDGVESLPFPPLRGASQVPAPASFASPHAPAPTTALEPPQPSAISAVMQQLPSAPGVATLLQAPAQTISSEGLAQLLGSLFSNQQQQQPIAAALLIPLQTTISNSGELTLAPLGPPPPAPPPVQGPPPAQAPPPVTQPALVDLVAQFLTPLLQQGPQGQQQQVAIPQQPAPQQHLPFALNQQQLPIALNLQQQRVVQQPPAQPQQQVVLQEQPVAPVVPSYQQPVYQQLVAQQQQLHQADVQPPSVQPSLATSSTVPEQTHLLQALQVIAAATAGEGGGSQQPQLVTALPQILHQQLANVGHAVLRPTANNIAAPSPAPTEPEGNHSEAPPGTG